MAQLEHRRVRVQAEYDPFYEIYLQLYPRLRDTVAQLQWVLGEA